MDWWIAIWWGRMTRQNISRDTICLIIRPGKTYPRIWSAGIWIGAYTGKKGNFLLFGIAIVFQIAGLMFGWLVSHGYVWTGRICLAFYTALCTILLVTINTLPKLYAIYLKHLTCAPQNSKQIYLFFT